MVPMRKKKNYPSIIIKYSLISRALSSSGPEMEIVEFANSLDPDEVAHKELLI